MVIVLFGIRFSVLEMFRVLFGISLSLYIGGGRQARTRKVREKALRTRKGKEKALPNAAMSPRNAATNDYVEALYELKKHVEENSDYVGDKFPEEARKIHYGEEDPRSIHGEATPDEAKELVEEGVDFQRIPWPKPDA